MRNTRSFFIGPLPIGGGAPVTVQSMTNTDTRDAAATLSQVRALAQAGCDIVRLSVYDEQCLEALPAIIESIQSQGYQIVPISELVLSQPYWIDHTGMQHAGNTEGGNGQ